VIDRLVRFVNAVSFHRGLALGALVGAAIAGSTLWGRLAVARRRGESSQPNDDAGHQ
jgi:hypothetical protein